MKCKFPIRVPYYKSEGSPSGFKIVPCGKCIDCQKQLSNNWTFRLLCQMDYSRNNLFVTLTYEDALLPLVDGRHQTLRKVHLTSFLKKFRDDCQYRYMSYFPGTRRENKDKRCPMKFFAIGDYGRQTYRPHYHILIFNSPYTRLELIDYIVNNWHFSCVNRVDIAVAQHAAYICKYMITDADNVINDAVEHIGVEPIFRVMSRGIGLAKTFDFLHDYLNGITSFQVGTFHSALPAYMRHKLDNYVYGFEDDKDKETYQSNVGKMRFHRYQKYLHDDPKHGYSKWYVDNIDLPDYLPRALHINNIKKHER